jgi:hypothetical protein
LKGEQHLYRILQNIWGKVFRVLHQERAENADAAVLNNVVSERIVERKHGKALHGLDNKSLIFISKVCYERVD